MTGWIKYASSHHHLILSSYCSLRPGVTASRIRRRNQLQKAESYQSNSRCVSQDLYENMNLYADRFFISTVKFYVRLFYWFIHLKVNSFNLSPNAIFFISKHTCLKFGQRCSQVFWKITQFLLFCLCAPSQWCTEPYHPHPKNQDVIEVQKFSFNKTITVIFFYLESTIFRGYC